MRVHITMPVVVAMFALLAAACGGEDKPSFPQGSDVVELDPAKFTTQIDNPYWPMQPGSRWVYRESDARGSEQRVEVVVTEMTKVIMGVEARVIHDAVTEDGQLVEDTFDWYAQDSDGNIWYLGEDTRGVRERQGHQHGGLVGGGSRRRAGRRCPSGEATGGDGV